MFRHPLAKLITFGALICAGLMSKPAWAQRYPVPVGAEHPNFKLPNIVDGKAISLSDYRSSLGKDRGQKVLLVHFASW